MSRLWSKVEKQNLNYIYKNNYIRLIMSESDEENYEDIDIQPNIIIKKQKETIPRLTKFERTKSFLKGQPNLRMVLNHLLKALFRMYIK